MAFVVKAAVTSPESKTFSFVQKVMYGGKDIATGDVIFVFASENHGGNGLIARGVVTGVKRLPMRRSGSKVRETPRLQISLRRTARARRALGRAELKAFRELADGSPQAEIAWKLYRQATDKIAGISWEATAFLLTFFPEGKRAT